MTDSEEEDDVVEDDLLWQEYVTRVRQLIRLFDSHPRKKRRREEQPPIQQHPAPTPSSPPAPQPMVHFISSAQQMSLQPKTGNASDPDHLVFIRNYAVSGEERFRVLQIINNFLSGSKNKGKKFRRAHDITLRSDAFIVPELPVDSNTGTQPICVICQEKILRGVPRCKFSIVHSERERSFASSERGEVVVDLCQTHVSHALCYAVQLMTLREGYEMVCFGTCLCGRGGCRQPKKG